MAERFELKIISPDEVFYEGEGTFLEFVSVEGEMGVYQNHIPLTTILEPCVMKIHNESEVKKAAILGGFVEIQKDKITVLAEDAQWPEEIDIDTSFVPFLSRSNLAGLQKRDLQRRTELTYSVQKSH